MDISEIVAGLKIERECVSRNQSGRCDRRCSACDIVQDAGWLIQVYDDAIAALEDMERLQRDYSKVLMETTGNRLSKTNYDLPYVFDCIREHYCDGCEYDPAQQEYEAAVEAIEYCERYEPTYNPEDGSL